MFYNGLGTFDSTNHMFYNDLARVAPQTQCFIMVLTQQNTIQAMLYKTFLQILAIPLVLQ